MKKMKKRVAVSCYEFQIVGLERSKRGLRGRPTVGTVHPFNAVGMLWNFGGAAEMMVQTRAPFVFDVLSPICRCYSGQFNMSLSHTPMSISDLRFCLHILSHLQPVPLLWCGVVFLFLCSVWF